MDEAVVSACKVQSLHKRPSGARATMSPSDLEYRYLINAVPPNVFHLRNRANGVKIDTNDRGVDMTDLVKERRAYVIDEEGKCGG